MLRWLRQTKHSIDVLPSIRRLNYEQLSPADKFLAEITESVYAFRYGPWRARRLLKVLELLPDDWTWEGKRVLELGAAHGDIGAFFADLGAEVVSVEGRKRNIALAKVKHRKVPHLTFVHRNLEEDFRDLGRFDLLIHFGLLYHITNIDSHLASCAAVSDRIYLETEVLDTDDPYMTVTLPADLERHDHGLDERGATMIGPRYIERVFGECGMRCVVHRDRELNVDVHVYDWEPKNDGTHVRHRRRFFEVIRA